MRVLVVSQYFWPENFRINEITQSLLNAGCTVDVLTGPPNYPDGKVFPGYSATSLKSETRAGVTIHRVPLVPRGRGTALRLMLNYLSFVLCGCLFGPWLLRGRPVDVVLVYAPGPILQAIPGLWLGLLKRARVVTWVQDLWPESLVTTGFVRNKHALGLVSMVVRWIYRRNDLLLVQSHAFIQPVTAMAGATPVLYHPNPGDLPTASTPRQHGEPVLRLNPGFNVVFAGNLGTVQALDTILNAAERTRELSDLWWVIVGSGSRGEWLRDEVRRRELTQVMLPGRFAPEAMPEILGQASALLVSLVRDPIMSQTIPSKVQAYLGSGKPIVASLDGEAARVIMEAGAGVACPAEDPKALAESVLQLKAMSADELQRLGENGREYYRQHFDPQVLTGRLLECFQRLLRDEMTKRDGAQTTGNE